MKACCTMSYALLECGNDERQTRRMMNTLTRGLSLLLLFFSLVVVVVVAGAGGANLIAMMYLPHANLCQFAEVLRALHCVT